MSTESKLSTELTSTEPTQSTEQNVSGEKKSSGRREQRAAAQQFIDTLRGSTFPNSQRIYLTGSQPDIRVPMREIQLSPTLLVVAATIRAMKPTKRCRSMTPPARMATRP